MSRRDQELPTIIEDRVRRGPRGVWFDGDIRGGTGPREATREQQVRAIAVAIAAHGIPEGGQLGDHEAAIRDIAAYLAQPERPAPIVTSVNPGHCRKGHPWTPDNTYLNRRGSRECKACRRVRDGKPRGKKK